MSTTQWIVLGVVIVFIVAVNYGLFDYWRKHRNPTQKAPPHAIQKLGNALMNPWNNEEKNCQELSRKVKELKKDE